MTTRTPAAQSTSTRPAAPRPSATEAPAGSIPGHLRRRTVVTAGVLGLCAGMPEIAAAAGPVGAGSPAPSAGPAPSPFASPSAEDATVPALIPLPVSVEAQAGEPFELTETTRIAAGGEAADAAAVLSEELRTATGLPLPVVEDPAAAGTIRLRVHEGAPRPVTSRRATASPSTPSWSTSRHPRARAPCSASAPSSSCSAPGAPPPAPRPRPVCAPRRSRSATTRASPTGDSAWT